MKNILNTTIRLLLITFISLLIASAFAQELTSRPILHFDVETKGTEQGLVLRAVNPDGRRMETFEGALGAVWSPDGKWFAFFTGDESGPGVALSLMNLQKELKTIFTFKKGDKERIIGWQPAWSADGKQIAFISGIPGETIGTNTFWIVIIDVSKGLIRSRFKIPTETLAGFPYFTSPPDKFRWSPNGRRILLSWGNAVVIDTTTGKVEKISNNPIIAEWTPDSEGIYYLETENYDKPKDRSLGSLYLRRLDSQKPVMLTTKEFLKASGLKLSSLTRGLMVLSPSASKLALMLGSTKGGEDICIHDLKEKGTLALDKAFKSIHTKRAVTAIEWAPDENSLACLTVALQGLGFQTTARDIRVEIWNLSTTGWKTLSRIELELKVPEIDMLAWKNLSWTR
jgi:dipeptidyl aminopeptidase/acylaminoacyl peptidase